MAENRTRKPYDQPILRKLTREQVQLLLLEKAAEGNQNAKDLLEIIDSEPSVKSEIPKTDVPGNGSVSALRSPICNSTTGKNSQA